MDHEEMTGRRKPPAQLRGNCWECMALTQATCALLSRDPRLGLDEAMDDVWIIYDYIHDRLKKFKK